jgi:hypothetical protein
MIRKKGFRTYLSGFDWHIKVGDSSPRGRLGGRRRDLLEGLSLWFLPGDVVLSMLKRNKIKR